MKNNRIKSFTLIELVLAMMLTAIVMGMAYTALSLFSGMYAGYRSRTLYHAQIRQLSVMLQRDMDQAEQVVRSGPEQLLLEGTQGSLHYLWSRDYLLRERDGLQDTFHLKGLQVSTSFEGHPRSRGLTDLLLLRFEQLQGGPLQLSVSKSYTSDQLFHQEDPL